MMIAAHRMEMLAAIFAGAAIAVLVGVCAGRIGTGLGLMDVPDPIGGRKRHDHVTPLVGGLACVLPALAALLATALTYTFPNMQARDELVWIVVATLILFLVGIMDDKFSLSPKSRFLISLLVFSVLIIQVPDLHLELLWFSVLAEPWILGAGGSVLSIVCLVGLLNALNMMDGKNGLVIGVTLFWTLALWIYAPMQLKPMLGALFAALLVLLYFNLRGLLFLGDSGVYGLSALLGMLAIFIYNRRPDAISADQIVLWLSFPVLDCWRVMLARWLAGRSPWDPGRDHFHHYVARQFGWDRGKYICWALVWVPGLASLAWPGATLLFLGLAVSGYASTMLFVSGSRAKVPLGAG
jgi:UDP-GlcNAc:undecaprenyl-phosphate/decaprenyl-phosphate GlcNAc-1-phosphate transferase